MGDAGQVFMSKDGVDTWEGQCLACIDMQDIGVGMGRVQDAGVQHVRLLKFSRVDGCACDQWTCIDTPLFLSHHPCPCYLPCLLMGRVSNIAATWLVVFVIHLSVLMKVYHNQHPQVAIVWPCFHCDCPSI